MRQRPQTSRSSCMFEQRSIALSSLQWMQATSDTLSILSEADSYGYEIIQRVAELTGGELEWTEAMLYPVLHRLESRALVKCYWQKSSSGRKRKYYSITSAGLNELKDKKRQWRIVATVLATLWKSAA